MTLRSALAGAATTAGLIVALGSPGAVDAGRDLDAEVVATTLTTFPSWEDVTRLAGDVVVGIGLRLGLTVVLAGLLCHVAGRAGSRGAAALGAWGATVVAAGAAGALAYAYTVAVVLDGTPPGAQYADGLFDAVDAGASFGLWTGWLVGLAVALATRPAVTPARRHPTAGSATGVSSAARPRIAEPPPPWWAPTRTATDAGVRPGPTAFPPGGMPPAPDRTQAMSTVSGDPHPSDPDATQRVETTRPPGPQATPTRESRATTGAGEDATEDATDDATDDATEAGAVAADTAKPTGDDDTRADTAG